MTSEPIPNGWELSFYDFIAHRIIWKSNEPLSCEIWFPLIDINILSLWKPWCGGSNLFVCLYRETTSIMKRQRHTVFVHKSCITHNKLLLIAGGDWLVVIAPLACRQKFLSLVCSLPRPRAEKYFSFYFSLRRALIYLLVVLNNILRCQFIWKEDQPFSRRRCYMDGKLKKPRFR